MRCGKYYGKKYGLCLLGEQAPKYQPGGKFVSLTGSRKMQGGLPLFLNDDKTGKPGLLSKMPGNFNRVLPMGVRVLEVSVAPPGFCAMSTFVI